MWRPRGICRNMRAETQICQLIPAEWPLFRDLRLEALRCEPAQYASALSDWTALKPQDWQRRLANAPVFVCLEQGEPVGMMGLLRPQARKMAHRATLLMVYLRAAHRGAGRAGALFDAVTAYAMENGISQIELAVSVENPRARRFYERIGFNAIGVIPCGFRHEGRDIDEVIMLRRL
jgi:ribosomal protein S18 acetylase RimI-like enzyme